MSAQHIFQRLSRPLAPVPTNVEPRLIPLGGIRAVLFDIYGTLLISASGDIGASRKLPREAALAAAAQRLHLPLASDSLTRAVAIFESAIGAQHAAARAEGIRYPEVDIVDVWRNAIGEMVREGILSEVPDELDFVQLATEYEARANPVWPMPGLAECLATLREGGLMLGLISNAQFFTPQLFPALMNRTIDELGFDPGLCYYSYEHSHAKPAPKLYESAREALANRGVPPNDVLYVGNDLRNDIAPAAAVGFRTALFAGDARSLRLRTGEHFPDRVEPDVIVTELRQIPPLLGLQVQGTPSEA